MSARRHPTASYCLHKQSGRARVVWYDSLGIRQQKLLPGEFDSPESRSAFARFQLELESAISTTTGTTQKSVSVNELMNAFLDHAENHYRRADGTQTHEVDEYRLIIRYVRELYGDLPGAEFGPRMLKIVRQKFIAADWCRSLVNQRIGRVRRMFKWAASEELVPVAVHQALATVQGLQRGRTEVRESKPIRPVSDSVVDATVPHLNRHVRGLVELQRLTGCRPGEACVIRRCDINMGGAIWLYHPPQHKTAWRGKSRTIAIGPRAQELLREFLTPNINDYLFSPARAVQELHAERGANRKTPRYPSHMDRNLKTRVKDPKRQPADVYDVNSYGHAIKRGCDKAFPPPGDLAQQPGESAKAWWARLTSEERASVNEWQRKHHWAPNRLRHAYATKVRKDHGIEITGAALGHTKMSATEVYAERDADLAARVAAKIG